MNNNQRANQIAIKQFRKELSAMLGDIKEIDVKVLTEAVNTGLKAVKRMTPVGESGNVVEFTTRSGKSVHFTTNVSHVGGFLRKSWNSPPVKKTSSGVTKEINNSADYASFVNDGHRIVQGGVTKGFVKGQFMLEKAIHKVDKALEREFQKEVERVNREHDK